MAARRKRRQRFSDSADVHTVKATSAVREVHRLGSQVIADAAAGHCGLAVGELFKMQRFYGAAQAHTNAGARVGERAIKMLQSASLTAGKAFLKFCTVTKKR